MNLHFSMWVFLSVFPFAIGYIVSESRSLSLPQIAVAMLVLYAFMGEHAKIGLPIMIGAFGVGFILPHIEFMQGVRNTLYNLYSSVRHRRLYEEIKRKANEFEEAKAQYERAADAAERARREYEEATRRAHQGQQNSSHSHSQQQRSSSKQQNNNHQRKERQERKQSSHSSSNGESLQDKYLKVLNLKAGRAYTQAEIKKAYKVMAMKVHPDRGGSDAEFQAVQAAYEWLSTHMA